MADVTIDPDAQTVTAERAVRVSGNSTIITIPPEVRQGAGIGEGDAVELVAHMDSGVIEVAKIDEDGDGEE